MNYNLYTESEPGDKKKSTLAVLKKLVFFSSNEQNNLIFAIIAILVNAGLNLFGPYMVGYTIDTYVKTRDYQGILSFSGILLIIYCTAFFSNLLQMRLMGSIGQRMLFKLRNSLFTKLQELPVDFFNQNKAGDLISRINNDTDKVNQFFSQSLMQFIGSIFTMIGSAVFLLIINIKLGAAALIPAFLVLIFTRILSPWLRTLNAKNLKSTGMLSSEVQESLNNFKVIVAFNRRDYFRKKFAEVNENNYQTAVKAGIANNIFQSVYGLAANAGQLIVLTYGIYLISKGNFSVGLLISFLVYITNFYNPMRQLAALWSGFQLALAAWDRIWKILTLQNNLTVIEENGLTKSDSFVTLQDVSFSYPNGKEVLHHVNINLERGKTYAFVGPTGGGKTTTASLLSRLYDTTIGSIFLDGKDIRSYKPEIRVKKVGFILQDPFLFSGTVKDNIVYGNEEYKNSATNHLITDIQSSGLETLLDRFENGLDTLVHPSGEGMSLGQKQLIAFMRAVLRKPELLILDEATANIDTITEHLLEDILKKLPAETTKVIIAHRLNTIENADEIFFVNSGNVIPAGSLEHAVNMLLQGKRES
ncbi:MAG: ABC transporter ATP-binding protein [Bacteroidales bacterium]